MYFKLSLKNVHKSFKDYTLYFLTLTFGVCIFYVFNSIEAQKAMMNISQSESQMMQTLTQLMEVISVFVSFVLGFLIVYANNFLIRRRKKEIGIYMTLGMEKGKVARLLVAESLIIGIFSLGAGLLAGVFISQGLSVITAKLFEVDMTGYKFIFSSGAFLKTIIYFGVIFLIVMVASTISISKLKLIDLINAEKQNEKQRLKSPAITIILFIMSIACIGTAYGLVLKNGIMNFDRKLLIEIILGSLGTFLFFASLSGFFLRLVQSNRSLYLKGLNAFILRQINSRINTAHISMSLICLMLFWTIGIFSTGMGMNNALNSTEINNAPYDVSLILDGGGSIEEKLKEYDFNLYDYTDKFAEFSLYDYKYEAINKEKVLKRVIEYLPEGVNIHSLGSKLFMLKLSEFNKLMELQGKDGVSLSQNQLAIFSDYTYDAPELKGALVKFIEMKYSLTIAEKEYEVYPKLLEDKVITSPGNQVFLALVVPDEMVEGSKAFQTILSFNCKGDSKAMQRKFEDDMYGLLEKYRGVKADFKITGITKEAMRAMEVGAKAIISFVGIYLGLIFLITSAAILALQQLSEAADNRHRYKILQKVGADDNLIKSALFKQIAIYFMMPLSLACVHSVVGIKVANDIIRNNGRLNATGNIIITAILIMAVYGTYFLATYFSSKRIILKGRT